MAVKTIVVGIGSEGYKTAEILVKKLESEHGSLDRVPWIKFVILETENTSARLLGRKGLSIHIGLNQTDFQEVKRSPERFDPDIDLTTWAGNADIFGGSPPLEGANNQRPLGRLCFMHPKNFGSFCNAIQSLTTELLGLDPEKTNALRGTKAEEDPIKFVQIENQHRQKKDKINIFVVGTLTGGTGSGCFVDVGYALRKLPFLKDQTQLAAILGIPNAGHGDLIHNYNAAAALTELNHYSYPNAKYKARFGLRSLFDINTELRSVAPFDYAFIQQPKSIGPDQIQIMRMAASEFINLEAVEDEGGKLIANCTNAIGHFGGELDRKGCPMRFFSLGASVIEYPADHIIEACASKIVGSAMGRILIHAPLSDYEFDSFYRDQVKIDPEKFQNAFLETEACRKLIKNLSDQAVQAAESAERGETSSIGSWRRKVEGLSMFGTNYAGEYYESLEAAAKEVSSRVLDSIKQELSNALRQPGRGPLWVAELLDKIETRATVRIAEIDQKDEIGARSLARLESSALNSIESKMGQKGKGCANLFGKNPRKDASNEMKSRSSTYISTNLRVSSERPEKELLVKLVDLAKLVRGRINNHEHGLTIWVQKLKSKMDKNYADKNTRGPVVSGVALFETERTVPADYQRCIRNDAEEKSAEEIILRWVRPYLEDALKDRDLSRFDRYCDVEESDLVAARRVLWPIFSPLKNIKVEDRLVGGYSDWESKIDLAARAGQAFIDVSFTDNQFNQPVNDSKRLPSYVFSKNPDAIGESEAGKVATKLKSTTFAPSPGGSDQTILFMQALGIFSLYSINGVSGWQEHVEPKLMTRMDVVWRSLDGRPSDPHQAYHIALILAGIPLQVFNRDKSGTLNFQTDPSPGKPGRLIPFSLELTEASHKLAIDKILAAQVEAKVKIAIKDTGLKDSIAAIVKASEHVTALNLTFDGFAIGGEEYFNRVMNLLERYPESEGMITALYPGYLQDDLDSYKRPDHKEDSLKNGWFCPHCNCVLALPTEKPEVVIPAICRSCGWKLRWGA